MVAVNRKTRNKLFFRIWKYFYINRKNGLEILFDNDQCMRVRRTQKRTSGNIHIQINRDDVSVAYDSGDNPKGSVNSCLDLYFNPKRPLR